MAKIKTVEQQNKRIKSVQTKKDYKNFYFEHFSGGTWIISFNMDMESFGRRNQTQGPEYFMFLALVGYAGARLGYPSLDGGVSEYQKRNHQRVLSDPRIQLARLSNTCYLELQAAPIKLEIIQMFKADGLSQKMQDGVWGYFLKSFQGQIVMPFKTDDQFKKEVSDRLKQPRPICLPDLELSKRIAGINFTFDDAERMPQSEFENGVLPILRSSLESLINIDKIKW